MDPIAVRTNLISGQGSLAEITEIVDLLVAQSRIAREDRESILAALRQRSPRRKRLVTGRRPPQSRWYRGTRPRGTRGLPRRFLRGTNAASSAAWTSFNAAIGRPIFLMPGLRSSPWKLVINSHTKYESVCD